MVRKHETPVESKGFDQDKGVNLNEELEEAGKATYETQFPDGEPTKAALGVRGDVEPEKKG